VPEISAFFFIDLAFTALLIRSRMAVNVTIVGIVM
jgi:hypothetical protein